MSEQAAREGNPCQPSWEIAALLPKILCHLLARPLGVKVDPYPGLLLILLRHWKSHPGI